LTATATTATTAAPKLATLDTLDVDLDGTITVTIDNGQTFRTARRRHDEDPIVTATRRLIAEGYRVLGVWKKTSALTHTATVEPHPQRCDTCANGCDCEGGSAGCPHRGCWGQAPETCDYAIVIRNAT
jgi:hypothetical protein